MNKPKNDLEGRWLNCKQFVYTWTDSQTSKKKVNKQSVVLTKNMASMFSVCMVKLVSKQFPSYPRNIDKPWSLITHAN